MILRAKSGTEGAADKRRYHPQLVLGKVEHTAEVRLNILHPLGLVINGQPAVLLRYDGGGEHLHWVVVFHWNMVFRLNLHSGFRQRFVGRAARFGWRHSLPLLGLARLL